MLNHEKIGRALTAAKMKSCGVTKLDHIKGQYIRGTLHIKEAIVENVKNERNDWFHSQDESNIARKTLAINSVRLAKCDNDAR